MNKCENHPFDEGYEIFPPSKAEIEKYNLYHCDDCGHWFGLKAVSISDSTNKILARKLRLAVINNVCRQGWLTDLEAKELLNAPLVPGDLSTLVDDSRLLHDSDALEKIEKGE